MNDREIDKGAKGTGQLIGWAVIRFLTGGLIAATYAPIVMLALGALHAIWHQVPAAGYWATMVVLWAFRLLTPYTVKAKEPEAP
jgi:hypothetical protein